MEGGAAGGRLHGLDHRRFTAPDAYRAVHDRHFATLADFVAEKRYYDLLLLDAAAGETCFSVENCSRAACRTEVRDIRDATCSAAASSPKCDIFTPRLALFTQGHPRSIETSGQPASAISAAARGPRSSSQR